MAQVTRATITKTISFDEIVHDRDASVRVTEDGMILAVDLVMVMTGQNKDHAGKTLRGLDPEKFSAEKFSVKTLPGSGNVNLKVVSFKDALELVMVLPGKVAKETRTQFARIIQRYMAGDVSLVMEVEANGQMAIPFDDIVPGATARLALLDGVQYLSVRDVLMHICELTAKRANEKWSILPSEVKNELTEFIGQYKFPGPGNPTPVPVITFKGVLKLIMLVSGQKAALYRSAMVKILQRYYAGDGSLVEEVEANAQSAAPIAQMARASLAAESSVVAEPVPDEQSLIRKRKLESLEIEKLELDITIRRREAEFEHASKITTTYRDLCQDTVMDTRARLMFKDYYLNMIMGPPQQQPVQANMIANGETSQAAARPVSMPPAPSKPISLSQVATSMGLKVPTNQLISLGGKLRKLYEEKHGHPPGKHEQLCDGRMTMVNSYSESDRPLVEGLLREWKPV